MVQFQAARIVALEKDKAALAEEVSQVKAALAEEVSKAAASDGSASAEVVSVVFTEEGSLGLSLAPCDSCTGAAVLDVKAGTQATQHQELRAGLIIEIRMCSNKSLVVVK